MQGQPRDKMKITCDQLKAALPLPKLMHELGLGDGQQTGGFKTLCPFHDDHNPSFSVFLGDNGRWGWKCFSGCGGGDEITFLAKRLGLDAKKDFRKTLAEYEALAKQCGQLTDAIINQPAVPAPTAPGPAIDWEACRTAATPEWLGKLASWRGYSLGLMVFLHKSKLIGAYKNNPAFPVIHDGKVVGIHIRTQDKRWMFLPKGTKTSPLIIGDISTATKVFACESSWDGPAVIDGLQWHDQGLPADTAIVITRGASNGKLLAKLLRPDATVYAWVQNDPINPQTGKSPALEWLEVICRHAAKVLVVKTPAQHKDPNDWLKAGATREDFLAAIEHAESAPVPSGPAPASPAAPQAPLPNEWFDARFPKLPEKYGRAALLVSPKDPNGRPYVKRLGEDFLAAIPGMDGSPGRPAVFLANEGRFFQYHPDDGIYRPLWPEKLEAAISALILDCARACSESCDTRDLQFKFRESSVLQGVTRRARAILAVPHDFFQQTSRDFIACQNGMLRLADQELLSFAPSYQRRNKLGVPFIPGAKCERFLSELMRPALSDEDIDLVQRWAALALLNENIAQKILVLIGTAGGGKGTFIRVLCGIVGLENIGSLRTQQLGQRFEIGLLMDKTLLYGADVPADFLNHAGAAGLKALTGGDPVSPEHKNVNSTQTIICRFNVVVSANSHLRVRLEGDADAWRRRLAIVTYNKPKPAKVIADLDKVLLQEEAPGILNWMLAGLEKLRADGWQLRLSPAQQAVVDGLLMESDSVGMFVREHLRQDYRHSLTVNDCYSYYAQYCQRRAWSPVPRKDFGSTVADLVTRELSIVLRHDVQDTTGKAQRGWKGLLCIPVEPQP